MGPPVFIWSVIDDEFRKRLEEYPRPRDVKPPKIQDAWEPSALPWKFFIKHICDADFDNGVPAVDKAHIPKSVQRHCLQCSDVEVPLPHLQMLWIATMILGHLVVMRTSILCMDRVLCVLNAR